MPNIYNEIPLHFIHEIKTKGYYVNVIPRKMMRFSREKGVYLRCALYYLHVEANVFPPPSAHRDTNTNGIRLGKQEILS